MGIPKYQQPQMDPLYGQLMAQSQQQDIAATQELVRSDTASLLARYGTRLAMAQTTSASNMAAGPAMRERVI